MDKAGKEEILGEIKEAFANVQSIVLADFSGVRVPSVTAIRDQFRKAGCEYRVLKNSLIKIAVKGSKLEPMTKLLAGPTAVIWSNDSPQTPAKIALKIAKDEPKFVIKGGYFDGAALDKKGIEQLSKLPGKPELQASLLMTFLAAPSDFVRTIAAAPTQFAYLLEARRRDLASK